MITRTTMLIGVYTTLMSNAAAPQDIQLSGQLRPRFEYLDRNGEDNQFTSMRMRVTLSSRLEGNVRVVLQVQDVRLWGEELNTLTDFRADNFDLHQGYIEMVRPGRLALNVRVGRQELLLGGERLVGPVAWTQQGRAFDGVGLGASSENGSVTLGGFKIAESTSPSFQNEAELYLAYGTIQDVLGGVLDIYGLYDRIGGATGTDRVTTGARLVGRRSQLVYRVETSYQFGEVGTSDIDAFMVAARAGALLNDGAAEVTVWYDLLSGDGNTSDNEIGVFNTLFATNHKFYGYADLFLDIPAHTGGLGLQDFAVKGRLNPTSDTRLMLDVHHFRTAKTGALTTSSLAEELDLTASHRYTSNLAVTAGASFVLRRDGLADLGRLSENSVWLYVMLDATF